MFLIWLVFIFLPAVWKFGSDKTEEKEVGKTQPVQKFNRDLGEICVVAEILMRSRRGDRDLREICYVSEMATRSHRDERDLVKINEISTRTRRDLLCLWDKLAQISLRTQRDL